MSVKTSTVLLAVIAIAGASAQVKLRSRAGVIMPPKLEVEWMITTETGDGALEPEERGVMVVRVKNLGGEARDVAVRLASRRPLRGLVIDSLVVIKAVPSQEIGEASLSLLAGEDVTPESVQVQISVEERSRSHTLTRDAVIPIVDSPGPDLALGQYMINNFVQGSTGAALTKGKETNVELEIRNSGSRKAREVTVEVSSINSALLLTSGTKFPLGDMLTGDQRYVTIGTRLKENVKAGSLAIKVRIGERRQKFSREFDVVIPVRASNEKRSLSTRQLKRR